MAQRKNDFALYCCELLSGIGPCIAKRMFGGFGISTGGLNVALVADLGDGEKLWLKADATTVASFEKQGCQRFMYEVNRNGKTAAHGLNYYTAPEEALEAPHLMLPWGRLALDAALRAKAAKPPRSRLPAKAVRKVLKC